MAGAVSALSRAWSGPPAARARPGAGGPGAWSCCFGWPAGRGKSARSWTSSGFTRQTTQHRTQTGVQGLGVDASLFLAPTPEARWTLLGALHEPGRRLLLPGTGRSQRGQLPRQRTLSKPGSHGPRLAGCVGRLEGEEAEREGAAGGRETDQLLRSEQGTFPTHPAATVPLHQAQSCRGAPPLPPAWHSCLAPAGKTQVTLLSWQWQARESRSKCQTEMLV